MSLASTVSKGRTATIKSILIAYNGVPSSDAALHGAVKMQKFFDAHLTGIFAHGSSNLSPQIKPWMPKKVQQAILEVADQSHHDVLQTVTEIFADVPADKLHWIDNAGPR